MFLKQLDQFMLQYYSFKAESIAKQQNAENFAIRVTSQIATRLFLLTSARVLSIYFIIHDTNANSYFNFGTISLTTPRPSLLDITLILGKYGCQKGPLLGGIITKFLGTQNIFRDQWSRDPILRYFSRSCACEDFNYA